jgi:hypothetical protein
MSNWLALIANDMQASIRPDHILVGWLLDIRRLFSFVVIPEGDLRFKSQDCGH